MNHLRFKHPATGEVKTIKVGWSWTCFFFSSFFGIPLFIRKLYYFAIAMICMDIAYFMPNAFLYEGDAKIVMVFLNIIIFIASIYFAIKANEMAAKNYIESGWEVLDKNQESIKFNLNKMGIFVENSPAS